MVIVHVEYCGSWGYANRFRDLRHSILKALPEAEVTGTTGRSSSFEVTIDGQLVFSKLQMDGFPSKEDVIKEAERAQKGDQPMLIEKVAQDESWCSLM